jgi:PqqD family protein of HPr-rel-A system
VPTRPPKIRGDLEMVVLDGEAVIYDEGTGELHHLNPTATIVLSMCDGTAPVSGIVGEIAEAFGVQADELEKEIKGVLREFRKAGLLEGSLKVKASHA